MKELSFVKMVASGNDFVLIEKDRASFLFRLSSLAKRVCNRKFGVGADGLLVLDKIRKNAYVGMRIFNADGSEAEMCGNGARCVARFLSLGLKKPQGKFNIKTMAGIIHSEVRKNDVRIKLSAAGLRMSVSVRLPNRTLKPHFINTGVPHTVVFVEGLHKLNVVHIGRLIRYHKIFAPKGTNVDFVEILSNNAIRIRTYERGVEDETLACGTGAVAAALITACLLERTGNQKLFVQTASGERLKVYFTRRDSTFSDVWLEGKARLVYKGVCYV